jgi:hypothetical protein
MMILNGLLSRLLFAFEKHPSSIDSRDDHDWPEQGAKQDPKNAAC